MTSKILICCITVDLTKISLKQKLEIDKNLNNKVAAIFTFTPLKFDGILNFGKDILLLLTDCTIENDAALCLFLLLCLLLYQSKKLQQGREQVAAARGVSATSCSTVVVHTIYVYSSAHAHMKRCFYARCL